MVVAFDMCVRERNRWRSLVRRAQGDPGLLEHIGGDGKTSEFERVHARRRPAQERRRPTSWKTSKSSKSNETQTSLYILWALTLVRASDLFGGRIAMHVMIEITYRMCDRKRK